MFDRERLVRLVTNLHRKTVEGRLEWQKCRDFTESDTLGPAYSVLIDNIEIIVYQFSDDAMEQKFPFSVQGSRQNFRSATVVTTAISIRDPDGDVLQSAVNIGGVERLYEFVKQKQSKVEEKLAEYLI